MLSFKTPSDDEPYNKRFFMLSYMFIEFTVYLWGFLLGYNVG